MSVNYPRVLLKLSGEALMKAQSSIDLSALFCICERVKALCDLNVQVGIVIGAGNIMRGANLAKAGFDQERADYMGMLGTVINGLALAKFFENNGLSVELMTLLKVPDLIDAYDAEQAKKALSEGKVVIFAGGTGKPFCTTDTAASARAIDIQADLLIKATTVDGIYTTDPKQDPQAKRYATLNYQEALDKKLAVMDRGAIEMCRDAKMPMRVLNLDDKQAIKAVVEGESIGTYVDADAEVTFY